MRRRVHPYDRKTKRLMLRFGEFEAPLADADIAQLHDTIARLHTLPEASVRQLCADLREMLDDGSAAESALELDVEGSRQVQLAVFCDQNARRPVSPALAEARRQAFRYLESQA